jgi:putative addiction module killer protein
MNKIRFTKAYRIWFENLKDLRARVVIDIRLNFVKRGSFGSQRSVGNSIFELKIDYGPGYRIYYKKAGTDIVVLLCGGDKSTQEEDIKNAKEILEELENGTH